MQIHPQRYESVHRRRELSQRYRFIHRVMNPSTRYKIVHKDTYLSTKLLICLLKYKSVFVNTAFCLLYQELNCKAFRMDLHRLRRYDKPFKVSGKCKFLYYEIKSYLIEVWSYDWQCVTYFCWVACHVKSTCSYFVIMNGLRLANLIFEENFGWSGIW